MGEELDQRNLIDNPPKIGKWNFYNIGSTSVNMLKKARIIKEQDYGEYEKNKVDALITDKQKVIAVIEHKTISEFRTDKQQKKAIEQEIKTAKALGSKIFIAQGGDKSIWLNTLTGKKIENSDGTDITELFNDTNEKIPELIEKINNSISATNNKIHNIVLVNPTNLARAIWQDIWCVSGATPENCLYTFVELFIFKYLSDLEILRGSYNFYNLLENYNNNTDSEVLETYARSIRPKIKELFPKNTIDNTTIINGTIFVSKDQKAITGYGSVFKKVLKKFNAEKKLKHIDHEFKSRLFESFLKESMGKKNWGQYFTPLRVVQCMVNMAKDEIKEGVKICDPACGVGKFLLEPIYNKLEQFYQIQNNTIKRNITITGFDKGFDKEEQKTIILAKANMLIYFSELIQKHHSITKEFAELFNDSFTLKTNSILGTLSDPIKNEYDLILTNPPYVVSGTGSLKEEIKKNESLESYYTVHGCGVEGLFMEWIIRALKPNGKAFIVVPDGIMNRLDDERLRQFILNTCFIDAIISLPERTFFTTTKKTYILALTKKSKCECQKTPVFTYFVSEIGESRDINRFIIEQNDLLAATNLFLLFKGNKNEFSNLNNDDRCKIQPITKFNVSKHWLVDRWWNDSEKIKLGIIEKTESIDLLQLSELLDDLGNTITSSSNTFREIYDDNDSKHKFKNFKLSDNDYFKLFAGKRVHQKDINKITNGTIPVYSADVLNHIGYHNENIIDNFKNDFVLWSIDSSKFNFNFIKKNNPFYPTDHCGVIRILNENIQPEYLMIELLKSRNSNSFDRTLRSNPDRMSELSIKIPIDSYGNISKDEQKNIINKYNSIVELRNNLKEQTKKINNPLINIKSSSKEYKNIKIDKLVIPKSGNSKLTKTYINNNKGKYPIYSSNTKDDGVLGCINTYKYDCECIQITTNGYAGVVFHRKGHKFSINNDAMLLIKISDKLDYGYLIMQLRHEFKKHDLSWTNKLSQSKLLQMTLSIPINEQGEYDLNAQMKIAEIYNNTKTTKSEISDKIRKIEQLDIDL